MFQIRSSANIKVKNELNNVNNLNTIEKHV